MASTAMLMILCQMDHTQNKVVSLLVDVHLQVDAIHRNHQLPHNIVDDEPIDEM